MLLQFVDARPVHARSRAQRSGSPNAAPAPAYSRGQAQSPWLPDARARGHGSAASVASTIGARKPRLGHILERVGQIDECRPLPREIVGLSSRIGCTGAEDHVRALQSVCIERRDHGRLATLFRDRKLILSADQLQTAAEAVLRRAIRAVRGRAAFHCR